MMSTEAREKLRGSWQMVADLEPTFNRLAVLILIINRFNHLNCQG